MLKICRLSKSKPPCAGRRSRTPASITLSSAGGGEVVMYTTQIAPVQFVSTSSHAACRVLPWPCGPRAPLPLPLPPSVVAVLGHQYSRCSLRPALIRLVNTPYSPSLLASPRLSSHPRILSLFCFPPLLLFLLCFLKAPCVRMCV